jgi:hypothetical protein
VTGLRSLAQAAVSAVLAVLSCGVFAGENAAGQIGLRWKPDLADTNRISLEVTGLPPASLHLLTRTNWSTGQWDALLSIAIETGDLSSDLMLPSVSGRHEVTHDLLRFLPSFPIAPGVRYRALFNPDALPGTGIAKGLRLSSVLHIPAPVFDKKNIVTDVFPSASVLPQNLLKFYLHFSAPMSRGQIYDHIHLLNAVGTPVELPFLEIDEELWNPEMTRLTLFLDPGRIKRGVKPLEDVGASLETGKSYQLVIDRAWLDATGTPMLQDFAKPFTIGPAAREPLDPQHWSINPPKRATQAPVVVQFDRPIDHALAERMLRVIDSGSRPVPGAARLGEEERSWSFRPDHPWKSGTYRITVPATLEDLAGNNIGKPFDVDLFDRVDRRLANPVIVLPFEID